MEQLNLHTTAITQMEMLKKDKVMFLSVFLIREGHEIDTVPPAFVVFSGVYQQSDVELLSDFMEVISLVNALTVINLKIGKFHLKCFISSGRERRPD